jgi:hypothetical protein
MPASPSSARKAFADHGRRPPDDACSTCPAPIPCAPAARTRSSPATRAGQAGRRSRAGPDLRGRRHQSAPHAAPDPGTQAGRPPVAAGAQHVRHRPAPRPAHRCGAPVSRSWACRSSPRSRPASAASPELLEPVDALVAEPICRRSTADSVWKRARPPPRSAPQPREAERIIKACVKPPERPDTMTGKIDACCCIRSPACDPGALLFVMFQAVFTWATP